MKASKLFTYSIVIILALFLQSCKSDSKDAQIPQSTQTQVQSRTAAPKAVPREKFDAASNAKIQKVIENTNKKIDQTEKEVDKLLEGI